MLRNCSDGSVNVNDVIHVRSKGIIQPISGDKHTHTAQQCSCNCSDLDVMMESDQSSSVARPTVLHTAGVVAFIAIQHRSMISHCSPTGVNYLGLTGK